MVVLARAERSRADDVARRIHDAVDEPVVTRGVTARVGASVGVAVMTSLDQRATIIGDADASMYRAKRGTGS